jgi:outer membrane lipoprotein-sorting protein
MRANLTPGTFGTRRGIARAAGHVALALLCACAAPKPRVPELPSSDPAAVLQAVRVREEAIRSMRAVFTATTEVEGRKRKVDGVLVVRKPDRFRLRLMLLNLTVLDYLRVGKEVNAQVPIEESETAAQRARYLSLARDDFASAFLRGEYAFPGACRTKPFSDYGVQVTCGSLSDQTTSRVMILDAKTGFIESEVSYLGNEPRMILQYDDYRAAGGTWMPFHIRMTHPREKRTMVIEVSRYDLNPELRDELFL